MLNFDTVPPLRELRTNGDLVLYREELILWRCNFLTDVAELVEYMTNGEQTVEECDD